VIVLLSQQQDIGPRLPFSIDGIDCPQELQRQKPSGKRGRQSGSYTSLRFEVGTVDERKRATQAAL
jgi:hypothetical protein